MTDTSYDATRLVDILVAARAADDRIPAAGQPVPPDFAAGMAAQQAIAARLGDTGAGWKVMVRDGTPIAAPLYPFVDAGSTPVSFPAVQRVGIEVELAVRLKADIPPRPGRPYSRAELLEAVDGVFLGIEPVASRLNEGNASPYPLFVADGMANAGYVLGPQVPLSTLDDFGTRRLVIEGDGAVLFDAAPKHAAPDPLAFFIAYANRAVPGPFALGKGQIVTTGSINGVTPSGGARTIVVRLSDVGEMTMTFG